VYFACLLTPDAECCLALAVKCITTLNISNEHFLLHDPYLYAR
jgi:hypothetical protein